MKKKSVNSNITTEVIAAYLDGNATAAESQAILDALSEDAELRELLRISQSVDAELGMDFSETKTIPMMALAANCNESSLCSLECEKYILRERKIELDSEEMLQDAIRNKWLK